MSVMLRNFTQVSLIHALHEDMTEGEEGAMFLGNGGWGGQHGLACTMFEFVRVKCKNEC